MRIILFFVGSIILLSTISSCGITTPFYNPTVFPFQYKSEVVEQNSIKKVIIAPVTMGAPVRSYMKKSQRKIKAMVRDYLESNGYEILPDYHFENAWKQAARTYGNAYDPTTGKIDGGAWSSAMVMVGQKLRSETDADAIVFADLVEHDASHSTNSKHHARWYGVSRKPSVQGATAVPEGFNWSQPVSAASLHVSIFRVANLERVFNSVGGLDTLQGISSRSSDAGYRRKKKILENEGHIEEGIEIAFHPFITMEDYPGVKK